MHPRPGLVKLAAVMAVLACSVSCTKTDPPVGSTQPWQEQIKKRREQIEAVKTANAAGFEAMDSGSLGNATLEMIPYVVFRVFQEIEPKTFSDEALNASGFFPRKDIPSGHNGIIWTDPVTTGALQLRYMTRTCSSCHTGRVRLEDGSTRLTFGGSNTEINLHGFIGRITSTLKADLGTTASDPAYLAFRKRVVDGLASHEAGWFYGSSSKVAAADAAKEAAAVTANIDGVLTLMRTMNDRRLETVGLLQSHSYAKVPNPPSLTGGAPGLIETSGLGSVGLVPLVGLDKADLVLPAGPSKADIPAIWQIDPAGYANWDGTIRGFGRALTSSMAVVGDPSKIDLTANSKIQAFLGQLPAEPYPFSIGEDARQRGEAIYQANCTGCHFAPGGAKRDALVFDVGTDPMRSNAMGSLAAGLMAKVVLKICPSTQAECAFGPEGPVVDPSTHRGYVAGPLRGVWAVAPYLHNGSVPTLRQLLVPSLRTTSPFLRGSISYNQADGGWEWDPSREAALRAKGDLALALHDPGQASFSPVGHGTAANPMLTDGKGKPVRVAWSTSAGDTRVVNDLIAYLLSL